MTEREAQAARRMADGQLRAMIEQLGVLHIKGVLHTPARKLMDATRSIWQTHKAFKQQDLKMMCKGRLCSPWPSFTEREDAESTDVREIAMLIRHAEHKIPVGDMTLLGQLLTQTGSTISKVVGTRLLFLTSNMGDSSATIRLVHAAVTRQRLQQPEIQPVLTHLRRLGERDKHPEAMILLGQIAEARGRTEEAIALYEESIPLLAAQSRKITDEDPVSTGSAPDAWYRAFMDSPVVAPWTALGNLRLAAEDLDGATEAFRAGALEGDDPMAYFALAATEEKYSDNWAEYVGKAAASGHVAAMTMMGDYYAWKENPKSGPRDGGHGLGEGQKREPPKLSKQLYEGPFMDRPKFLATAWYFVAGIGGHGPSALESARRLIGWGEPDTSVQLLRKILFEPGGKYRREEPRLYAEAKEMFEQMPDGRKSDGS